MCFRQRSNSWNLRRTGNRVFLTLYLSKRKCDSVKKGDEEKNERKNQLLITEVGMDLKNVDYTDVWRNMLQFSLNKHEKK